MSDFNHLSVPTALVRFDEDGTVHVVDVELKSLTPADGQLLRDAISIWFREWSNHNNSSTPS